MRARGCSVSFESMGPPGRGVASTGEREPLLRRRLDAARHLSQRRGGSHGVRRPPPGPLRCRRKFLRFFPGGFRDETYLDWERGYKEQAHERWEPELGRAEMRSLLAGSRHAELARRAVAIESRTNLLFSFEKMALRDAVRTPAGARAFGEGLWDLLHGRGGLKRRFERWVDAVDSLPRRQTRVLTWPLATVFGFLAQPDVHIFFKPMVTRRAAA